MRKLLLLLFTFWTVALCAQSNYQSRYTYPVLNQKTQFYLNPDFLAISITNVNILKNVSQGTVSIDSNTFLNYTTGYFNIKDSCLIEISYLDQNAVSLIDTFTLILTVLGKANTYSYFYHTGKILTKQFYSSTYSDSVILGQNWDFGDSKTSTDPFPKHVYSKGGNYNVCLTSFTKLDTNTYCDIIFVNDTDYVEVTDDYYTIYFPDSATKLNVLENDFQYNGTLSLISNGKYSKGQIINNELSVISVKVAPKTYDTLTYQVCKNGKCDTANAYVYQFINYSQLPCFSDFQWQANKKTVRFNSEPLCKNGKGSIQSFTWRIDTLVIGTKDSLNYTFPAYGYYNVCLDLLDTFGLVNSSCKGVSLFDNACYPQYSYSGKANEIEFYNESFCFGSSGDSTLDYVWKFGDGNLYQGLNAKHFYKKAGNYKVCLGRITSTDTFNTCNTIIVYDSNSLVTNDDYFIVNTSQNPSFHNLLDNDIALLAKTITIIDSTKLGSIRCDNSGNIVYLRRNKYTYGTDSFRYAVCTNSKCDTAIGILQSGFYFINPSTSCTPQILYSVSNYKVNLTAKADCVNGKEGAFLWYFDDGTFDTSTKTTKSYDYPGYKDIKLLMIDTAGNWSFTQEMILIIDTSLNNGCVYAQPDHFTVNNFYNIGSNIIHNDYNINFKTARTIAYSEFKNGVTLLDSFGNINWIPDSAYSGCDTMQYIVFDSQNTNCLDTAFITVCYEDLSVYCVDSSLIDTTIDCNYGYMPVCGCDKKEYDNFCDAYTRGGITQFFNGPCTNLPPSLSYNGSSIIKEYTIYNDEVSSMPIDANDPNSDNVTSISSKLAAQFSACLKTEIQKGQLICYPSKGCVGNYILYISACDNWGYCTMDTLKINVLNKTTSGIKLSTSEAFKVYPNPSAAEITLSFSHLNTGDVVRIIDITGQQIGVPIPVSKMSETIHLETFKSGLYYIQHLSNTGEILSIVKISKI